jgi:hypothetical protein
VNVEEIESFIDRKVVDPEFDLLAWWSNDFPSHI